MNQHHLLSQRCRYIQRDRSVARMCFTAKSYQVQGRCVLCIGDHAHQIMLHPGVNINILSYSKSPNFMIELDCFCILHSGD